MNDMASKGGGAFDRLLVAGALVFSLGLVWLTTGEATVVAAFGGGLLVLGTLALLVTGRRRPRSEERRVGKECRL